MIAGHSEQAEVFDRASALNRVCDDEEFFLEIIDTFLELCPDRVEQIRDAVARGDSQQLQRAAHAMKGSAGNFSASAAVQASFHLETLARAGEMDATPEALRVFEDEIERLRTALSKEKER